MFGLTIITEKKLIDKNLKIGNLRNELFLNIMKEVKLNLKIKDMKKLIEYKEQTITKYFLEIQQLKEKEKIKYKKEQKEINKLPLLPQKKYCSICNKAYFVTVKKFSTFKNIREEIVNICEDCVKLHKLNSKEK